MPGEVAVEVAPASPVASAGAVFGSLPEVDAGALPSAVAEAEVARAVAAAAEVSAKAARRPVVPYDRHVKVSEENARLRAEVAKLEASREVYSRATEQTAEFLARFQPGGGVVAPVEPEVDPYETPLEKRLREQEAVIDRLTKSDETRAEREASAERARAVETRKVELLSAMTSEWESAKLLYPAGAELRTFTIALLERSPELSVTEAMRIVHEEVTKRDSARAPARGSSVAEGRAVAPPRINGGGAQNVVQRAAFKSFDEAGEAFLRTHR